MQKWVVVIIIRWKYSSADKLGSLSVPGEVSTYGGGGYYVDFDLNMDDTNTTMELLLNSLWLDRATRAVILQFTTYNPYDNLFFTLRYVNASTTRYRASKLNGGFV